jgi:hypothetical protein
VCSLLPYLFLYLFLPSFSRFLYPSSFFLYIFPSVYERPIQSFRYRIPSINTDHEQTSVKSKSARSS